ncbi:MAG: DUF1844 domain-containing protein [Candidatus Zixiibacteriota bacterium]|nr:MAG: DUF1844 domain-containing protein [candidate division Zixibacteria bacterium]
MPENESEKKGEFYFVQLVITFQAAAMQQMGKLQNPLTKKVERNLDQARFSIDMLEMLQDKTKNNLTENEKKFLEHTLYELRMNYMDEVKKDQQEEKERDAKQKEEAEEPPGAKESKAEQDKERQEDKDSARMEEDGGQSGTEDSAEKKD